MQDFGYPSTNRRKYATKHDEIIGDFIEKFDDTKRSTRVNRENGDVASNTRISEEDKYMLDHSVGLITTISMDVSVREPWKGEPADESTGSCWLIRLPNQPDDDPTRYVATCYHCVENAFIRNGITITMAFTGNKKIPARVVAIIPHIDCAILQIIPEKIKDLDFNKLIAWELGDDKIIHMGDKVMVYGYPMGQDKFKAVESTVNGRQDGSIQLDGAINPGHSGGPVIYDRKVIGWITSGLPYANAVSYANPISILKIVLPLIELDLDDAQIIHKDTLGVRYFSGNDDRLMAVGARKEECTVEDPCDCESGIVLRWVSNYSPIKGPPFSGQAGDIICSISGFIEMDDQPVFHEFKIDNDGEIKVPWGDTKLDMSMLLDYFIKENPVVINLWKSKERRLVRGKALLRNVYRYGLYHLRNPYEKIDYEVFGGLVVADMTADVIEEFGRLDVCLPMNQKEKPHVVIVNIFLGSPAAQSGNLREGSIVMKVNGIPVHTVDEYRLALRRPIQGKYIFIETDKNQSEVLNLKKVLDMERSLSSQYMYKPSQTYKFFASQ